MTNTSKILPKEYHAERKPTIIVGMNGYYVTESGHKHAAIVVKVQLAGSLNLKVWDFNGVEYLAASVPDRFFKPL